MPFGLRSFSTRDIAQYNTTSFTRSPNNGYSTIHFPTPIDQSTFLQKPIFNERIPLCGCDKYQKTVICYTPTLAEGICSCSLIKDVDKLVFTTDKKAAIIPAGAIIDSIEYFGIDVFTTKDLFSIGLGQLNQDISFPLIVDADSTIANEKIGGKRDFVSTRLDGKTENSLVLCDSNINVRFFEPVTSGSLQINIRYHLKI